jgi:hypothetical protein
MYRSFVLAAALSCTLNTAVQGAMVLQTVASSTPPFRFTMSASTQPTVVEATTNLLNWVPIQTNAASASPITITDAQSVNFPRRFYRVRNLGANLSDLGQTINSVFMAGEGFNAIQFAPNGRLGFIVWRGQDLVYRERNGTVWSEQVIGAFGRTYSPGGLEEYRFQPQAALLFDSLSQAHILWLSGATVRHHIEQSDGHFVESTPISLSGVGSSFSLFSSAIGPGDKLHLAVVGSQSNAAISYGSNKNGSWQWSTVTNVIGDPRGFLKQSYTPRWFSMAIDSQNNAHLTFCPQFALPIGPEGYLRPYDQLRYASNRGGNWINEVVADISDLAGDAGAGASIAIGPDDQPAIAAWFNKRYQTGSSLYCLLNYHTRVSAGNWSQQTIASTTAGYIAADTDKGAGFAPYLRFDSSGRPNIAFCDDASQHFPTSGQNEYAGDLRHAYFDGNQWVIRTVFAQTAPLDHQVVYPAMATLGNEIVFMGLDRQTVWQQPDYRIATSTYQFFYVTMSFP